MGTKPTAVIFGVTGQDGSYLADLLLEKNYYVVGVSRRTSTNNNERIRHIDNDSFKVVDGDITDASSVSGIISEYKPDECYNLAAQSHVATSFKQPSLTLNINTTGVLNILESIKNLSPSTKFYQASTSEMFGGNYSITMNEHLTYDKYQDEFTPFSPNSPYAISKLAAHNLVRTYRESYGLHASCGILFNHESERRGEQFVTRKITKWIGEYKTWMDTLPHVEEPIFEYGQDKIYYRNILGQEAYRQSIVSSFPLLRLGNIETHRDWGYAPDYVEAMWLMLQQKGPDDFVICTEQSRTIKDFLKAAFQYVGIESYRNYIVIDKELYRPNEVFYLRGISTKAREVLGWVPKTSFETMVARMVEADYEKASQQMEVGV